MSEASVPLEVEEGAGEEGEERVEEVREAAEDDERVERAGEGVSERVRQVFSSIQTAFQEELETKEKIRNCVRGLEQEAREIFTTMQAIHHSQQEEVPAVCEKMRALYPPVRTGYSTLQSLVQAEMYYRYHDFWRFVTQRLAFLSSLVIYLESGRLATRSDVAQMLGVHTRQEDGFHLDLEDFLTGLLSMANELSRLAINSVTQGDFQRPFSISLFITDLSSGFRLLNLKNDALRKRFDALKYDVKKVEGVVYDVTIRGLKPQ